MQQKKRAEELGESSQNVSKNIKHATDNKANRQDLKRKRKETPGQLEANQNRKTAKTQVSY